MIESRKEETVKTDSGHKQSQSNKTEPSCNNTDLTYQFEKAVKELELTYPLINDPVTPDELLDTLKEDVIFALERPGSWEGSLMLDLLNSHGFISLL